MIHRALRKDFFKDWGFPTQNTNFNLVNIQKQTIVVNLNSCVLSQGQSSY